ncbi:nuclease [Athelia psychrophila]|uniref:Nuclease n=1 Tax=Athelia psychrophila TaxID=1759441 RepID=A0A166R6W2_9AGAM|nr:nuclease [Fibularhizoctonia sp. CBS 109695]
MSPLPWFKSDPPKPPSRDIRTQLSSYAQQIPAPALAFAFVFGGISLAVAKSVHKRYFRRLRNSDYINTDVIARKRWIKGVVTSVGDADNFRLYHTPGFGWRWPLKFRRVPTLSKELKDETIHIRIAGVDAPEAAHFGRPSQPYSAEALAWLKGAIEGKKLRCLLLRRDQYARVVGLVELPPRFLPGWLVPGKSLGLEMLKAGWATTYQQAGAEYGKHGKGVFLQIEAKAKAARRGMWAAGVTAETPAEYKKRHAKAEAESTTTLGKTAATTTKKASKVKH